MEEFLGSGAFGSVYKCTDDLIPRTVAVKELGPSASSSLSDVKELSVPGRLTNPHVVQVFDVLDNDSAIVMEYVSGGSLGTRIKTDPVWVRENFIQIVLDICEALRASHSMNIVHRDIKPDNILITDDGRAKVGDFGVCTVLDIDGYTETPAGTPAYMSVEALEGLPYGTEADVHSLGCVMYEMLVGQRPWVVNGYAAAYLVAKTTRSAPLLSERAPDAADLIVQLIARTLDRGARRIRNVDVVAQQLTYLLPNRRVESIDDLQLRIGAIYSFANSRRSPLTLLSQYAISLRQLHEIAKLPEPEQRRRLAKSFAWLCSVATSINIRIGQAIWLKFEDGCPYCGQGVCTCTSRQLGDSSERNLRLLRKMRTRQVNQAPRPEPASIYRARFARIYKDTNDKSGYSALLVHTWSEVAEAIDAFMHLDANERDSLLALHLEFSDLVAWFFAIANFVDEDFDLAAAVEEVFADGCYACGRTQCVCPAPLGIANWREALGKVPAYEEP